MPRLFTGLELPADLRMRLSILQSGFEKIRWVEPSDMHITLRFIGDVSPTMANEIVDVLDHEEWVAPEIKPGDLRCFGGNRPSSLYVSVRETTGLMTLAAKQERMMQALGLEPEGRRFTPHITIGRFRSGVSAESVAAWLSSYGGFGTDPFYPARFALYSAKESVGGGPYRVEETFTFESSPSS